MYGGLDSYMLKGSMANPEVCVYVHVQGLNSYKLRGNIVNPEVCVDMYENRGVNSCLLRGGHGQRCVQVEGA